MIGYVITAATGFFVLCLILPKNSRIGFPSRIVLSAVTGSGIASIVLFVLLLSPLKDIRTALIITETALLIIAACAVFSIHRGIPIDRPSLRFLHDIRSSRFAILLAVLLGTGLIASIVYFIFYSMVNPHGGWDTITIWNFRARGLFRGREMLAQVFSHTLTFDHHADYPLFIPLTVLHGWIYAGRETFIAPMAVGFFCTYGTIIVLMDAVYRHRGALLALIAGCALAGIQSFHHTGVIQYADMPLAFLFLASVIFIHEYMTTDDRSSLLLAGSFAAMAAWTKNEGISFFAAFTAAWVVHTLALPRGDRSIARFFREAFIFMLGALPFVLVIAVFKKLFPVANDIVGQWSMNTLLAYATDPERYRLIFSLFTSVFFQTRLFTIIPVAVALLAIGLGLRERMPREKMFALPLAILITGAYFTAYLTTPNDLRWQLHFSLDRLILQLYPFILFSVLFAVRSPERQPSVESSLS